MAYGIVCSFLMCLAVNTFILLTVIVNCSIVVKICVFILYLTCLRCSVMHRRLLFLHSLFVGLTHVLLIVGIFLVIKVRKFVSLNMLWNSDKDTLVNAD